MTTLPWNGLHEEQGLQLVKEVYDISQKTDNLIATREEHEYEFKFELDQYVVLAQIMLKLDKNLRDVRHQLVPDMVEEEDFWRNYFYQLECCKAVMGIDNNLGSRIPTELRAQRLQQKIENAQLTDKKSAVVKESASSAAKTSKPKVGVELEMQDIPKQEEAKGIDDE